MHGRRGVLVLLLLVAAAPLAYAGGASFFKSKPNCVRCIPDRDYQYQPEAGPELVVSRRAVLVRNLTLEVNEIIAATEDAQDRTAEGVRARDSNPGILPPPSGGAARLEEIGLFRAPEIIRAPRAEVYSRDSRFALTPPESTIHLYQLPQAELVIGHCAISQITLMTYPDGRWLFNLRGDQNRPDGGGGYNPTLHIKRNQFLVTLRCLGEFGESPATEAARELGKPVLEELGPFEFWVENGRPRYIRTEGFCRAMREHFQRIDRVEIDFRIR